MHAVVAEWRAAGPALLEPETDPSAPGYPTVDQVLGEELSSPHGVYLYKHRNEPVGASGRFCVCSLHI